MNNKKIKIPDGFKFNSVEGGNIILEPDYSKLPKNIKEACKIVKAGDLIKFKSGSWDKNSLSENNPNDQNLIFLPVGYLEKIKALGDLLILRDAYRNGWVPNWNVWDKKYSIYYFAAPCGKRNLSVIENSTSKRVLTFQDKDIANEFLNNFYNLIETAGDLI